MTFCRALSRLGKTRTSSVLRSLLQAFSSEGSIVTDENRAFVVLVAIVVGTLDEVDGIQDVGGVDDEALAVDDEVVSEARQIIVTRLMVVRRTIRINEDIFDFTTHLSLGPGPTDRSFDEILILWTYSY